MSNHVNSDPSAPLPQPVQDNRATATRSREHEITPEDAEPNTDDDASHADAQLLVPIKNSGMT